MNQYLKHYATAVTQPNVSGFEHLEMLLVRDKLAESEDRLSGDQRKKLRAADHRLLSNAAAFCRELQRITDLSDERERRQPSAKHWWWWLDDPALPLRVAQAERTPAIARSLAG